MLPLLTSIRFLLPKWSKRWSNCAKRNPQNSYIVIDSDISDAIALADRMIVLANGEIVMNDKPITLLRERYQELHDLGIRIPEHLHVMNWNQTALPGS